MSTLRVPVDLGEGPPIVLLHGFAMLPQTYRRTAILLAERARVLVPDLFSLKGPWRYEEVLQAFTTTLDELDVERASFVGHSFGGSIELGFAARYPHRVTELVFSDTLAVSREWRLADEALRHPVRLLRLATPQAAVAFAVSWAINARQLVTAGLWAFLSERVDEIGTIAAAHLPTHVLWANRDSILSRLDGEQFAGQLNSSFTVAAASDGRAIDHDWVFQEPELFVAHLKKIGMLALCGSRFA